MAELGYLDIVNLPGGRTVKARSTLGELKDVAFDHPSNGQILRYHSGSGWENYTASEMINTDSTIYCNSYASTTSKKGTSANWSEKIGWYNIILASGNSATSATLSVNEGTAYPIYNNGQDTDISSSATIAAGSHLAYFDGSAFRFTSVGFGATGYTMTSNTLASNRIKIFGSAMPQTTNIGIHPVYNGVLSTYTNSNILVRLNGSSNITPKINGQSSSSSGNNTIDVGMHYPYYDGTTWWFRNDGKLTAGGYCIPNGTSSQFLTGDGNYQTLYFDGTVASDNPILTESSLAGIIGAMVYKGIVNSNSDLPSSGVQAGWTYVVATAGTYAGQACEVGDMIIAKDTTPTWNVVNGENQVTDGNQTLSWGTQSTVATVDGTDIHVTMPANPNTDTTIYCDSPASTKAKTATCANFDETKPGWYKIFLKYGNTANSSTTSVSISVNGGTAFLVKRNGLNITTSNVNTEISAGLHDVYFDGTFWRFTEPFFGGASRALSCNDSAASVTKYAGSSCPFTPIAGNYPFYMAETNTASAPRININGTAYESGYVYVNGTVFSSTNPINAGWHYPYFDGTDKWWFRNDGKLTAGGYAIPNGTTTQILKADGSYQVQRTINGEPITADTASNIGLYDGYVFPNAVQDYDGNWYSAVVINDKVWLGENLRTKHLADGTAISSGASSSTALNYYNYSAHSLPVEKRGLLYSYPVVSAGDGAIIENWKSPSEADYDTLASYLDNQVRYSSTIKAMAATDGWATSETENAVGNNLSLNNGSGFRMYPTGCRQSGNNPSSEGISYLWTTTGSNKPCVVTNANSIAYTKSTYAPSSWMLALRLVSTLTPEQFRAWYVAQYGTMQHHFSQKIKVGDTTFGADDTINIINNGGITITPNATDKTITISTDLSGYMSGPSSSIDDDIVIFDGTTGKLAKESNISIKRLWEDVDVVSGIGSTYPNYQWYLNQNGNWTIAYVTYRHCVIPVDDIRKVTIVTNSNTGTYISFFKSYTPPTGVSTGNNPVSEYATGYNNRVQISGANATQDFVVPFDAKYLYVYVVASADLKPAHIYLTGIGITEHRGSGNGIIMDDGSVTDLNNLINDYGEYDSTKMSYIKSKPIFADNLKTESSMPTNYVEYDYVYNNVSTSNIPTNVYLTSDDIEFEIVVAPLTGSWHIFETGLTGSDSTVGTLTGLNGSSSGSIFLRYNNEVIATSGISRIEGHIYTINFKFKNGTGTLYVKDETTGEEDIQPGTYTPFTISSPAFALFRSGSNRAGAGNKIYRLQGWKDGVKVVDWIPAFNSTTTYYGFWDRISQTGKGDTSKISGGNPIEKSVVINAIDEKVKRTLTLQTDSSLTSNEYPLLFGESTDVTSGSKIESARYGAGTLVKGDGSIILKAYTADNTLDTPSLYFRRGTASNERTDWAIRSTGVPSDSSSPQNTPLQFLRRYGAGSSTWSPKLSLYSTYAVFDDATYGVFAPKFVKSPRDADSNILRADGEETTLALVATSGSYADVSNKPVLNTNNTSALTVTDSETITGTISLHKVAKTGTYSDLIGTPVFRTINGESLTANPTNNIGLYDGYVFPNAVQDYDENWYSAVVIGDQVWLGENLRTTHLANGTAITDGGSSGTDMHYRNYASHQLPVIKRGLLYSYPVAAAADGAIIANFKAPSSSDYSALTTYLGNQSRYASVIKSMAATDGWATSETENAVGNNLSLNNGSGFRMYPTGTCQNTDTYGNGNNSILWVTGSSNSKPCVYTTPNTTAYGTVGYNYSSFLLALRLVSTLTPQQFRAWYVAQYGTMQHYLDGSGSGLDADTLDGHHASDFAIASNYLPLAGGTETTNLMMFGYGESKLLIQVVLLIL